MAGTLDPSCSRSVGLNYVIERPPSTEKQGPLRTCANPNQFSDREAIFPIALRYWLRK